jgi:hypothetical protein
MQEISSLEKIAINSKFLVNLPKKGAVGCAVTAEYNLYSSVARNDSNF